VCHDRLFNTHSPKLAFVGPRIGNGQLAASTRRRKSDSSTTSGRHDPIRDELLLQALEYTAHSRRVKFSNCPWLVLPRSHRRLTSATAVAPSTTAKAAIVLHPFGPVVRGFVMPSLSALDVAGLSALPFSSERISRPGSSSKHLLKDQVLGFIHTQRSEYPCPRITRSRSASTSRSNRKAPTSASSLTARSSTAPQVARLPPTLREALRRNHRPARLLSTKVQAGPAGKPIAKNVFVNANRRHRSLRRHAEPWGYGAEIARPASPTSSSTSSTPTKACPGHGTPSAPYQPNWRRSSPPRNHPHQTAPSKQLLEY